MRSHWRSWLLALALALCGAGPLAAQRIEGVVLGRSGNPLAGVLVTLHDSTSLERGRAITTASGGFGLGAPAGPFRLSVARIGYHRWFSPDYRVAGRDTLRVRLDVESLVYELPELVATAPQLCRAESGGRAALLWEDARTALSAANATLDAEPIWYQVHRALRRLDRDERLAWDSVRQFGLAARWPVESAPPDELFERGFVQPRSSINDLVWFGPDLEVLFDPRFLELHCLRAVDGPPESGLTGVAFSPVRGRKVPDISGTLWFEAATRKLAAMDFFHTRLPRWVHAGSAGGRLEFVSLPDGRWLVERWRMRAPVPRRTNVGIRLDGYAEFDGQVVVALDPGRDTLWTGLPLRLGSWPDSGASPPSSGVEVRIRARSDDAANVLVRNATVSPVTVRAVRFRACVNLLERCANYPLALVLEPGQETVAMVVHSWMRGRRWSAEAEADWH